MKIVILCGGQGTRLREETEYRPKPLVDVGGRPILWHIMKLFAHHGFRDFIMCLGYRGNMIKEYFLNYEAMNNDFTICLGRARDEGRETRGENDAGDRFAPQLTYHGAHSEQDFRVTVADTGLDTMTGGRVRRIRRHITDDTFMVTYGDGLADVDVRSLISFHHTHGRLATVTTVCPTSRFGLIALDDHCRVSRFTEKPRVEGWISAGFFVFNRRIFDYLDGDDCILEREPLERLAAEGQLMAYKHDSFFFAMDTYREYKVLNDLWAAGKAPWRVWQ
jgi:glucose-1-phosphate cytidylyltransferase